MFSFVDQITYLDEGSIRGRFGVPEHFQEGAPDWLIVEAIGQLAAWVAMRNSDFAVRPVGATVGRLEFSGPKHRCGVLQLSATIGRTDRRAILYGGSVSVDDGEIARMERCIGPLLPMEAFEDPEQARLRFDSLLGPVPVDLWSAQDPFPGESVELRTQVLDGHVLAELSVAADAPLFREHFPLQPVVPATLIIGAMCNAACIAVAHSGQGGGGSVLLHQVRQVKVRQFTKPGDTLLIDAPVPEIGAGSEVQVSARNAGDLVATVRADCRESA